MKLPPWMPHQKNLQPSVDGTRAAQNGSDELFDSPRLEAHFAIGTEKIVLQFASKIHDVAFLSFRNPRTTRMGWPITMESFPRRKTDAVGIFFHLDG